MQEIFGKEQYQFYLELNKYGLSIQKWRKFQGKLKRLEVYIKNGWDGILLKMLGSLSLHLKREKGRKIK